MDYVYRLERWYDFDMWIATDIITRNTEACNPAHYSKTPFYFCNEPVYKKPGSLERLANDLREAINRTDSDHHAQNLIILYAQIMQHIERGEA